MRLRNTTHGLSDSFAYRSWKDMRARCNNPNDSDYKDYGGRGILVCKEWDDFGVFFADMGERPTGKTLDRIDVDGDYCAANCRWATPEEQANNKRTNRLIVWGDDQKTLAQWCRETGVEHSKAQYRLKQGWPVARVFSLEDFRL